MTRLIDADDFKKHLDDIIPKDNDVRNLLVETIKNLIDMRPTVTDAEVVRQGEWLISDKIDNYGICSNCNFNTKLYFPNINFISDYNYCPCCGAKMKKIYTYIK